jgi:hypothetical protein
MRIYVTTCVIKQAVLYFLKLYKFCALSPPDVTTNQDEKMRAGQCRGHIRYVEYVSVIL